MRRYQIGDKVRLRKDLVVGKRYGDFGHSFNSNSFAYTHSMYEVYKPSDVVTISRNARTNDYSYYVHGFEYAWWTDEMFEGLAEPEPSPTLEPPQEPTPEPTDWFDFLF